MAENQAPDVKLPDPVEMSRAMTRIAEQSQRLVTEFLSRQAADGVGTKNPDPMGVGHAFLEMTTRMMADPAKLMKAQMTLWQDYLTLWQRTTQRFFGQEAEPVIAPAKDDRRFKDSAWDENTLFDFIKQSYLLSARWMQSTVNEVDGLDDHTAKKVDFYTRQFVDAMAPSNFVMTNPEVLRTTIETGGENLVKGLEHLLKDLERGKGELRISMTAQVYIVLRSAKSTLTIPSVALGDRSEDGRYTVRVLNADGSPTQRMVEVGINNRSVAQVLDGLSAGDRVIVGEAMSGQFPGHGMLM